MTAVVQDETVSAALKDEMAGHTVDFKQAHDRILDLTFDINQLPAERTRSPFPETLQDHKVLRYLTCLLKKEDDNYENTKHSQHFLRTIVAVLRSLHDEPVDEPESFRIACFLRRVLSSSLYALVDLSDGTSFTAHSSKHRNALLETFLRNILNPLALSIKDTTHMISVLALARLTGSTQKLPREVVDSTLRPSLVRFCDLKKRTPTLVAGMHRAIEIYPSLFSASFADKLIDTLRNDFVAHPANSTYSDVTAGDSTTTHVLPLAQQVLMACLIIDTFRMFTLNATIDCGARHIPHLCALVGRLIDSFPATDHNSSQHDYRADLDRALCVVLYHHPTTAVDCLLGAGRTCSVNALSEDHNTSSFARAAVQRVVALPEAHPLRDEMTRRSGEILGATRDFHDAWCSGIFADVILIATTEMGQLIRIPSHRIVLSQQSPYFHALLTNGMRESRKSEIEVDFDEEALRVLLEWMYTLQLRMPTSVDKVVNLFLLADQLGLDVPCHACELALTDKAQFLNEKNVEMILEFAEWREDVGAGTGATMSASQGAVVHYATRGMLLQTCRSFVLSHMGRVSQKLLRSTLGGGL